MESAASLRKRIWRLGIDGGRLSRVLPDDVRERAVRRPAYLVSRLCRTDDDGPTYAGPESGRGHVLRRFLELGIWLRDHNSQDRLCLRRALRMGWRIGPLRLFRPGRRPDRHPHDPAD